MTPLESPGQLRDLLGVAFTEEQLEAATAPAVPGLIVAGAGSGKTTVMAARVVWLVGTGQVEPDQVLGLTFTNKAAGELAQRVRDVLRATGVGSPSDGSGEPVVSTYHAFAGRLVSEHGLRLGIEPRSRLLADATRYQLSARVLRRYTGRLERCSAALRTLVGNVVALDAELSEHLVEPEALLEFDGAWIARAEAACAEHEVQPKAVGHCKELRAYVLAGQRRSELTRVVAAFRRAKRDLDALDFGDQVALAARLAEQVPEVGQVERARVGVVLLDEYQDTSVAQRRMLAGLFGAPAAPGFPVTAVGDPCQAIYAWRGASVANLDEFPAHFPLSDGGPAAVFSLAVNQRSGGRLLDLANTVSADLQKRHGVKKLEAPPAKAAQGEVLVALATSWREEVDWVAGRLHRAVEEGTKPGECAVLVRARSDFADLHAALVARGLPVEVVGLGGLLALPEVADVVAVLEVLEDPTANAALLRLLTGPRWRLGARDLACLGRQARRLLRADSGTDPAGGGRGAEDPLAEAVSGVDPCDVVALADALERPGHEGWSEEGLRRVTALNAELRRLRRFREEPLLDLLHRVVEETGLDVELAASPEGVAARRQESLSAFLDVAAGFTDLDGESSLAAFLAFLRAATEHERGLDTASPRNPDAVQLLTMHKAKGLEWDVVACPNLTKGVFPNERLQDVWVKQPCVLPGPLRGDAAEQPLLDALDKPGLAAFDIACRAALDREERRLAYVAFTRARRLLIGSGHWWGPTQKKPRGPSVFLEELREHAATGGGRVEVWAEAPAEAVNPALSEAAAVRWPVEYEPERLRARQGAAAAVRQQIGVAGGTSEGPAGLSPVEAELLERLDREAEWLLGEARRSRDPEREVALPVALSATQVVRLRSDPDGLARELARPLPRRPVAGARRGTLFHAWVETLFGQRPLLGPDELPGSEDDEPARDEELELLRAAFLAGPYAGRVPHAVEAPFVLPLGGRLIRGRIDAVYGPVDGRWEVVDWKTGREPADPLQLAVYRLAWAGVAGVAVDLVDAAFCYVRTGEVVRPAALPGEAELAALLAG